MCNCGYTVTLSGLGELSETEALAIVTEELKKLPATELIKVVSGDLSGVAGAVKNGISRICVAGAKSEITDFISQYWWLILAALAAGGIGVYYLVK